MPFATTTALHTPVVAGVDAFGPLPSIQPTAYTRRGLHLVLQGHRWLLRDTRGLPGTEESCWLTRSQASAALVARPFAPTPEITWALERKVGVTLDGWYVPLATAEPALLQAFEAEREQQELISLELKLQPQESVYV